MQLFPEGNKQRHCELDLMISTSLSLSLSCGFLRENWAFCSVHALSHFFHAERLFGNVPAIAEIILLRSCVYVSTWCLFVYMLQITSSAENSLVGKKNLQSSPVVNLFSEK